MMSQAQIEWQRRRDAGLPVFLCPRCKAPEAHWVPDSLDGSGLVPGYYECEPKQLVEAPTLDFGDIS